MKIDIDEDIRTVLIIEDEALLALMMEDLLRGLGVENIHIADNVQSALELIATNDIDCAVLDMWIRDGESSAVADSLAERGIPFFFATGSGFDHTDARHQDRLKIGKPFTDDDFTRTLLDTVTLAKSERRSRQGAMQ